MAKQKASRPTKVVRSSPRRRPSKSSSVAADPSSQRLNKVLAAAGLGSRREVEALIVQGRVEIDRDIVTDLSRKVDPRQVTIKVDGQVLKQQRLVYYALNKPTGVLSTNRDPDGRMRVIDLVPTKERVFSVGRLDRSSEGLILLTNDGELAQRLAHPKFSVQKAYFVVVSGVLQNEDLAQLRKGVYLAEGFARIDGATIRRQRKGCTELEIVLSEGKNREIRRILARAGHKVVVLRRIAIGPLRLGQLPVGASRLLNPTEVKALYAITEKTVPKKTRPPRDASTVLETKPASSAAAGIPDDDDDSPVEGVGNAFDSSLDDEGMDDDYGMDNVGLMGDGDFDVDSLSDDDFVGPFSGSSAGSVLGYDDDGGGPPSRSAPAKRQASGRRMTSNRRKTNGTQSRAESAPASAGSGNRKSGSGSGERQAKNTSRGKISSGGSAGIQSKASTVQGRSAKTGAPKSGKRPTRKPARGKSPGAGRSASGRNATGRRGSKGR